MYACLWMASGLKERSGFAKWPMGFISLVKRFQQGFQCCPT